MNEANPSTASPLIDSVPDFGQHQSAPETSATQHPQQELIDSVPGFARSVTEVAKDAVTAAVSDQSPGKVTSVAAEDFKGDPTKVMGHPSNPNASQMQAVADSYGTPNNL